MTFVYALRSPDGRVERVVGCFFFFFLFSSKWESIRLISRQFRQDDLGSLYTSVRVDTQSDWNDPDYKHEDKGVARW